MAVHMSILFTVVSRYQSKMLKVLKPLETFEILLERSLYSGDIHTVSTTLNMLVRFY